jgi:myo-inositol catabolism protein IolC
MLWRHVAYIKILPEVQLTLGPTELIVRVDDNNHMIKRFYDLGIYPDWWKLEPFATAAAWENACATITRNDPHVRGVVVLGLDAPEGELATSLALAAAQPLVKGFAVGRTIFGEAARGWLAGTLDDDSAVAATLRPARFLIDVMPLPVAPSAAGDRGSRAQLAGQRGSGPRSSSKPETLRPAAGGDAYSRSR